MTQFSKARWVTDGDQLHLGVEFSKVNKQKRLVSGWATLDNVDTENDVVTAEASADAFARARGNLREMHKKDSAVGRIVSFKEDEFRAPDGQKYRGIFVTARVSEGAQDTWLKVLDGTLSGFSIGGEIVDSEEDFNKASGEKIRKVTRYNLNELSLVDNPGNQYGNVTNVFKIMKSADGSVTALSGMVEDHKILNVFWCDEHSLTKESPLDSYKCPVPECETSMKTIGYIEDGADRDRKVRTLVTKFISEGGEHMEKANNEGVDGDKNVSQESGANELDYVNDDQATHADPTGPEDVVEVSEETDEVTEVQDEEEEIAKRIDSLKDDVVEILKNSNAATVEKIEALEKSIKEMGETFEKKASEFESKLTEFDNNLGKARGRLADFEKSLEKMNSSTALRKSADSNDSVETEQNNDPWQGSAFSVHDLTR